MADAKKKADEGVLQQMEEMKKKMQRDSEITQKTLAEMEVARDRIERSKRKLQQEVTFSPVLTLGLFLSNNILEHYIS